MLGCAASGDHPRVGGEKPAVAAHVRAQLGSPPRWRGKVFIGHGDGAPLGITPAQAGKSKLALCTPSCPTDHPRACGEKNKELEGVWLPMGSPPRGRGKGVVEGGHVEVNRIIPAWAGKRRCTAACNGLCWDHPRMGGEKRALFGELVYPLGSPPRGWGKGAENLPAITFHGITPAWAGKSPKRDTAVAVNGDHPRVGGEKVTSTLSRIPK